MPIVPVVFVGLKTGSTRNGVLRAWEHHAATRKIALRNDKHPIADGVTRCHAKEIER